MNCTGVFALAATSVCLPLTNANAVCSSPPGDVTLDGIANVVDVQCVALTALWGLVTPTAAAPGCLGGGGVALADLDCTGVADISDLQFAVWHALGTGLPGALDANGDLCADACESPAVVVVKVISTGGAPVSGATLELGGVVVSTDSKGNASWTAPPLGQQRLRADHPEFAPKEVWLDIEAGEELETHVVLVAAKRYGPFDADAPIAVEHTRARVQLPGGAVVMPDGAPAAGPVEVLVAAVDPYTALLDGSPESQLGVAGPGDVPDVVDRHHLVEVRLLAGGQPAQLAPGAKATLRLPADALADQGMTPGSTVQAWWYDQEAALWRAEGSGELQLEPGQGLVWVAEVSHFTWWMAGSSTSSVACVRVTVQDALTQSPVAGAKVWATYGAGKKIRQRTTKSSGDVCFNFYTSGEVFFTSHHTLYGAATEMSDAITEAPGGPASCVQNPENCAELVLELELQACLRGVLLAATGAPLAGHPVMAALTVPGISGEVSVTANSDENGQFCIAGLPQNNVRVWSSQVVNGVVHRAWVIAQPTASPEGCGGAGCKDLGVLQLAPEKCGAPGLPAGALCALSGPAGSVQTCPLCIASTAEDSSHAVTMSGVVRYDQNVVKLDAVSTVGCLPGYGCFEIDLPTYAMNKGHTIYSFPSVPKVAKGAISLVLFPSGKQELAISSAVTDGSGSLTSGAPALATLKFMLTADIAEESPMFVMFENYTLEGTSGRALGSYVVDGLVTTSEPLSLLEGTESGCPPVLGDLYSDGKISGADLSCGNLEIHRWLQNMEPGNCIAGKNQLSTLDFDCSGSISAFDLSILMRLTTGNGLDPYLDQNGNGCVDRCEPITEPIPPIP
jgi:hypothetical protein